MKKLFIFMLTLFLLISTCGCASRSSDEDLTVTYFNVGKADAILLQTKGQNVLIDTGETGTADSLVSQLKGLGVKTIDVMIITHFDKDHVGGAGAILNNFTVKQVYQSNYLKNSDEYNAYRQALGDINAVTVFNANIGFQIGAARIVINGPGQAEYENDPSNNSSLITVVTFGSNTLLFLGDAENDRMEEFAGSLSETVENVILKVPHHGNYDKNIRKVIQYYVPAVSIISCSTVEPEPEKLEKTIKALQDAGSKIYYTYSGNIRVLVTEDDYTVSQ